LYRKVGKEGENVFGGRQAEYEESNFGKPKERIKYGLIVNYPEDMNSLSFCIER
jgi:hypothetical protein